MENDDDKVQPLIRFLESTGIEVVPATVAGLRSTLTPRVLHRLTIRLFPDESLAVQSSKPVVPECQSRLLDMELLHRSVMALERGLSRPRAIGDLTLLHFDPLQHQQSAAIAEPYLKQWDVLIQLLCQAVASGAGLAENRRTSVSVAEFTGESSRVLVPFPTSLAKSETDQSDYFSHSIKDIVQVSHHLIDHLKLLDEKYYAPLAAHPMLDPRKLNSLFSNFKDLISFQTNHLKNFVDSVDRITVAGTCKNVAVLVEGFDLYKMYCVNLPEAHATLEQIRYLSGVQEVFDRRKSGKQLQELLDVPYHCLLMYPVIIHRLKRGLKNDMEECHNDLNRALGLAIKFVKEVLEGRLKRKHASLTYIVKQRIRIALGKKVEVGTGSKKDLFGPDGQFKVSRAGLLLSDVLVRDARGRLTLKMLFERFLLTIVYRAQDTPRDFILESPQAYYLADMRLDDTVIDRGILRFVLDNGQSQELTLGSPETTQKWTKTIRQQIQLMTAKSSTASSLELANGDGLSGEGCYDAYFKPQELKMITVLQALVDSVDFSHKKILNQLLFLVNSSGAPTVRISEHGGSINAKGTLRKSPSQISKSISIQSNLDSDDDMDEEDSDEERFRDGPSAEQVKRNRRSRNKARTLLGVGSEVNDSNKARLPGVAENPNRPIQQRVLTANPLKSMFGNLKRRLLEGADSSSGSLNSLTSSKKELSTKNVDGLALRSLMPKSHTTSNIGDDALVDDDAASSPPLAKSGPLTKTESRPSTPPNVGDTPLNLVDLHTAETHIQEHGRRRQKTVGSITDATRQGLADYTSFGRERSGSLESRLDKRSSPMSPTSTPLRQEFSTNPSDGASTVTKSKTGTFSAIMSRIGKTDSFSSVKTGKTQASSIKQSVGVTNAVPTKPAVPRTMNLNMYLTDLITSFPVKLTEKTTAAQALNQLLPKAGIDLTLLEYYNLYEVSNREIFSNERGIKIGRDAQIMSMWEWWQENNQTDRILVLRQEQVERPKSDVQSKSRSGSSAPKPNLEHLLNWETEFSSQASWIRAQPQPMATQLLEGRVKVQFEAPDIDSLADSLLIFDSDHMEKWPSLGKLISLSIPLLSQQNNGTGQNQPDPNHEAIFEELDGILNELNIDVRSPVIIDQSFTFSPVRTMTTGTQASAVIVEPLLPRQQPAATTTPDEEAGVQEPVDDGKTEQNRILEQRRQRLLMQQQSGVRLSALNPSQQQ